MRKIVILAALLLPAAAAAQQPFNVTLAVKSDGAAAPTFTAATNLPGGMRMDCILSNNMGYYADIPATVQGGGFKCGPFKPSGGGNYFLEITSSDFSTDPASVFNVIGQVGELMTGPSVVQMGAWNGIDLQLPLTISGGGTTIGAAS